MIGFRSANLRATVIQSWDPAIKESEQANYSVCTTWLYQDKLYYLVDVFRDRIDYPTLKAEAISLAGLHKPNVSSDRGCCGRHRTGEGATTDGVTGGRC